VDALVDELGRLLQQRAGQDDNARGTVTDLVVLRLRQLY
jgi:hypothetical protein